jgi:5'-3' exonuclease
MGIPSYFSYLIKNHFKIIKPYTSSFLCHNLYLDSNSIIYDVYNSILKDNIEPCPTAIIQKVINQIEIYIEKVKPLKTIYIAFDGVAPVAKLNQQRERRYKSWYQGNIYNLLFNKSSLNAWNTASITPGTIFMENLNEMLYKHFDNKSHIKYHCQNIIVSGSDQNGEGEHKIFQYIRQNNQKHSTENTVIYGLDADLIMLSINHTKICPNIFLLREAPHFIQSLHQELNPNDNYLLDIPELTKTIILSMTKNMTKDITKDITNDKIKDYIFLCFLLGNDFLPHFPAINIRTGGIDKLLMAYNVVFDNINDTIIKNNIIQWANFRKYILYLSGLEEMYYKKEHNLRNYKEKMKIMEETPEEKYKKFEIIPGFNREVEKFINPYKEHWQSRYYKMLFPNFNGNCDANIKQSISQNYLEGLEWTFKYYTTDCIDWRWTYNYHYPPLLADLLKEIPLTNKNILEHKTIDPVSELVQLSYVLPKANLHLLPNKISTKLTSYFNHIYKEEEIFLWAYCKYFWESHVVFNDWNIEELEKFINNNKM